MGKGHNKPKPQNKPSSSTEQEGASSRAAAAEASRKRNKKGAGGQFPWLASLATLAAAIGVTLVLTRSPALMAPEETASVASSRFSSTGDEFKPQDRAKQCASWVKDGECTNNREFMREKCPGECADKAKKARKSDAPEKPRDADPNCYTWAASGECQNNPEYMLKSCPNACANGGEQSAEEGLVDIHQDCAAWVSDGECFRNPAFMLQQCKKSCSQFAKANDNILQDTSDSCVNFALRGGCQTDPKKASSECRASCHIQRICGNHTAAVACSRALRCEAIGDHKPDCAERAKRGECLSHPTVMLKNCLKSCSELDLDGMMRFHLPHERTRLSKYIDLPGAQPRLAGFYETPPQARNTDLNAKALCDPDTGVEVDPMVRQGRPPTFAQRMRAYREALKQKGPYTRYHWDKWDHSPAHPRTPRVPHLFRRVPADSDDDERHVVVEHISFSPRIRYLHRLLTAEECDHVVKIAQPLFSRSPVRGSVTRVRTSTTAMLGGRHDDAVVRRIRQRIARFSGYDVEMIEPLQVVRYERGQKYEGHHDFFDVCDLEDKSVNGRRQVTFLIYLVDMPEGERGGGTRFPELQLEVMPEKGSAIVFNDCFDNGEEDGRSLHAGQPPLNPATVKYAINGWIRARPVYGKMGGGMMGGFFP